MPRCGLPGRAIIFFLTLFRIGGRLLVCRCELPRLRMGVGDSEFSGTMVQTIMVF